MLDAASPTPGAARRPSSLPSTANGHPWSGRRYCSTTRASASGPSMPRQRSAEAARCVAQTSAASASFDAKCR